MQIMKGEEYSYVWLLFITFVPNQIPVSLIR